MSPISLHQYFSITSHQWLHGSSLKLAAQKKIKKKLSSIIAPFNILGGIFLEKKITISYYSPNRLRPSQWTYLHRIHLTLHLVWEKYHRLDLHSLSNDKWVGYWSRIWILQACTFRDKEAWGRRSMWVDL